MPPISIRLARTDAICTVDDSHVEWLLALCRRYGPADDAQAAIRAGAEAGTITFTLTEKRSLSRVLERALDELSWHRIGEVAWWLRCGLVDDLYDAERRA